MSWETRLSTITSFVVVGFGTVGSFVLGSEVDSKRGLQIGQLAPTPIHSYQFNGNLLDDEGGPPLESEGGVVGSGNYTFDPNQGLIRISVRERDFRRRL